MNFENQNNPNQNNPNQNNRNQNMFQNNQNNQNQMSNRQNLANQGPFNAGVSGPNLNAGNDTEFAAELNPNQSGEMQRLLNSKRVAVEFGYIQDSTQMRNNNAEPGNMNNPVGPNNNSQR